MIPKASLVWLAAEADLQPTTIEKDYVLGWILYGIAAHQVASRWVFKGGTCLKKCFFNTYRFSEDLDFTVPAGEPYSYASILRVLQDIMKWVERQSGIEFPADGVTLEECTNPRGKPSFQGKATFVGPLRMPRASLQRVKFDLTNDEVVVDTPVPRAVNHTYDDEVAPAPCVLCYSVSEILAEKSRALYEREGRARDVYDVVHVSRAFRKSVDQSVAMRGVSAKFAFKGLPEPTVKTILDRVDAGVLAANWNQQLGYQLPLLPDVAGFIEALPDALAWWLEPETAKPEAPAIPAATPGEVTAPRAAFPMFPSLRPLGIGVRGAREPGGAEMGRIVFAGRNRLCLRIRYHGVTRLVEPYSIRHPRTGHVLLYVWERERGSARSDQIKAFKIQEIQGVEVTGASFLARYLVEL